MTTCSACGSTKIIPSVPLRADVGGMEVTGGLFARVCGECGHTDLHVRDFRFLYDHYEASRKGQSRAGGKHSGQVAVSPAAYFFTGLKTPGRL